MLRKNCSLSFSDFRPNTDVLDFQYSFPIDKQNGGTSDPTWRQYAPMSSANAQWDQERSSDNEIAKYKCLDSGQGCGSGTTELTIDANWTATTESSGGGGSFTGYKVTQRNFSRSTDNLLNSTVTVQPLQMELEPKLFWDHIIMALALPMVVLLPNSKP